MIKNMSIGYFRQTLLINVDLRVGISIKIIENG